MCLWLFNKEKKNNADDKARVEKPAASQSDSPAQRKPSSGKTTLDYLPKLEYDDKKPFFDIQNSDSDDSDSEDPPDYAHSLPNDHPPIPPLRQTLSASATPSSEEREIQSYKREIRATNQKSLLSTESALTKAEEAEETGRNVLKQLNAQHIKLTNAERNIELAKGMAEEAAEKTKELEQLKSVPFFVYVPAAGEKKGAEKRAAKKFDREMEAAERSRREAFESSKQIDRTLHSKDRDGQRKDTESKGDSKYLFEPDPQDRQINQKVGENMDKLEIATKHLKDLALATSGEIDRHNKVIARVAEEVIPALREY
jgi:hypothetical protein